MRRYRTLALAAFLLIGVGAATAGDWTDDARLEKAALATPASATEPSSTQASDARPATVVQAWALFPPAAAKRGLPREPRRGG